ncbi:MAG: DUF5058 family protein [Clostridiales bacterium]|jgi:hypothetical protein|nr:DUF5058 family protein [Clostridiales bacterium]
MDLNAGIIYLIVAVVIAVVCAQAVFFLVKAYREGVRIGMSKETLNKAITSSAVFSVLPSLGILVTMFGLIKFLGIPFSWLRLTVIGSLMYEITAADTAAAAATGENLADAVITPEAFVTIAIVMSVGIILGGILCVVGLKKYSGVLKKITTNSENRADSQAGGQTGGDNVIVSNEINYSENRTADGNAVNMSCSEGRTVGENAARVNYLEGQAVGENAASVNYSQGQAVENKAVGGTGGGNEPPAKKKKVNFSEIGNLISTAVFIALCSAYIGGAIGQAFGGFHIDSYTSVVPFISMLIAVGCMAVITKLQKKHAWLQSFSLSFSMLVGMISAVPVSLILGAIF